MTTLEEHFQDLVRQVFPKVKRLDQKDLLALRHFFFLGADVILCQVFDDCIDLHPAMTAQRLQQRRMERDEYNAELSRLKAKRKGVGA